MLGTYVVLLAVPTATRSGRAVPVRGEAVVVESVGLVVANAVITRLSEDAATKRLTGRGDREAMKRSFAAAWTSTLKEDRRVLSDYDVNESFWRHEGAGEIARILLPESPSTARPQMSESGLATSSSTAPAFARFRATSERALSTAPSYGQFGELSARQGSPMVWFG